MADTKYIIAPGKALSCGRKGIKAEGAEVTVADVGTEETFNALKGNGFIVAEKPAPKKEVKKK